MSTGQVGTIFAKLGVSSLFHRSDVNCFHVLWYESALELISENSIELGFIDWTRTLLFGVAVTTCEVRVLG
jgi:hypothetical protein